MAVDKAHELTDKEIERIQKHIARFYSSALKDVDKILGRYVETIKEESDKLYQAIADAKDDKAKKAAESAYKTFYITKVKRDRRFKKAAQEAAERLYEANKKTSEYINTQTAKTYAENYNYIGRGLQKDLDGYELKQVSVDEAQKYGRITQQSIDKRKDEKWNRESIANSVIGQALMLRTASKIFSAGAKAVVSKNKNSANRQASDTMTDAENKGRFDSMYRAYDEGFEVNKIWSAILDNRTRETHRDYDGEPPHELDYEYAPGLKKPKDPDCEIKEEVCNCRCAISYTTGRQKSKTRAAREGDVTGSYKKSSSFKGTKTVSVPNMSYREWMEWRSK